MTATSLLRSRSVVEIFEKLNVTVRGLQHALVLGSEGKVVGKAGYPSDEVVGLVQSLAGGLTSQSARLAGESARCTVTLSRNTVIVYVLGVDLAVALVGPPRWNVALASRLVEPLLVRFVDTYLAELVANVVRNPEPEPPSRPVPSRAPKRTGPNAEQYATIRNDTALAVRRGHLRLIPREAPAQHEVPAQREIPVRREVPASAAGGTRTALDHPHLKAAAVRPEYARDPRVLDQVLVGLAAL